MPASRERRSSRTRTGAPRLAFEARASRRRSRRCRGSPAPTPATLLPGRMAPALLPRTRPATLRSIGRDRAHCQILIETRNDRPADAPAIYFFSRQHILTFVTDRQALPDLVALAVGGKVLRS